MFKVWLGRYDGDKSDGDFSNKYFWKEKESWVLSVVVFIYIY